MTSGIREWLESLGLSQYAAAFEGTELARHGSEAHGPSSRACAGQRGAREIMANQLTPHKRSRPTGGTIRIPVPYAHASCQF